MTDEWIDGYGYPPPHRASGRTTVAESTVPVPVSLIRELHTTLGFHVGYEDRLTRRVGALLSQPTPTAEPWYDKQPRTDEQFVSYLLADPPRIEDMAPGTTFTARIYGDDPDEYPVRFRKGEAELLLVQGWRRSPIFADELDPSTIRDVTPPA